MISELENFYLTQPEPLRSCMLAARDYILSLDQEINVAWKYKTPFFTYKKKNLCYVWRDKKTLKPYIGFIRGYKIDHPLLESGGRSQIRVLPFDAEQDLPTESIAKIINELKKLY